MLSKNKPIPWLGLMTLLLLTTILATSAGAADIAGRSAGSFSYWQGKNSSLRSDQPDIVNLDILSINDFHGAILGDKTKPGAARLAYYLKAQKANNPNGTLILAGGDMMTGNIVSTVLGGEPVIAVMNEIGFDAMAIGNHEFDLGINKLQERARQASFPFLTANIKSKPSGAYLDMAKPYVIIKREGIKIGIIGLSTLSGSMKTRPGLSNDIEVENPAQTVNAILPELQQNGVEVIIVLAHLGGFMDKDGKITGEVQELAQATHGVDGLITAHTHQKMAGRLNGIPIVQASYDGQCVGRIKLSFSRREGRVIASSAETIDLAPNAPDLDAKVEAIVNSSRKKLGPGLNLMANQSLSEWSNYPCKLSAFNQVSADMLRQKLNTDLAFIAGGKPDQEPDDMTTLGKLVEIYPFDDKLYTLNLSGAEITGFLNYAVKNPKIPMFQFSGLKLVYDGSRMEGERLTKASLLDGSPLVQEKTYRVLINGSMAQSACRFSLSKERPSLNDTQLCIQDVLIEAVKNIKSINFKSDNRLQEMNAGQ